MKAEKSYPHTTVQTQEMAGVDILEIGAMRVSTRQQQLSQKGKRKKMETTNRQAFNVLIFFFSLLIIGLLTTLSWILAFANDEQGPSLIGSIGHYMLLLFRFPTHNIIWLRPELISTWFVPGLAINVFLYSALTTVIMAKIRAKKEKAEN